MKRHPSSLVICKMQIKNYLEISLPILQIDKDEKCLTMQVIARMFGKETVILWLWNYK